MPTHLPSASGIQREPLPVAVRRPHLKALTGLRIFAALHVVAHHFLARNCSATLEKLTEDSPAWAATIGRLLGSAVDNILEAGPCSVSLFFILSGFILAYNYLDDARERQSAGSFWIARIARIYPVYMIGWLIASPRALLALKAGGASLFGYAITSFTSATMLQSWLPYAALKWNGPGWSLSAEAFFYFVFPLLFFRPGFRLFGRASKPGQQALLLVSLWIVACIPGLIYAALNLYGTESANIVQPITDPFGPQREPLWADRFVRLFPLFRLPEFLIGVLLGRIFLEESRNGRGLFLWLRGVPTAVVVCTVIAMLACSSLYPSEVVHVLPAPLLVLLIYRLAQGGDTVGLLSHKAMILLGEASYSLYILHMPIGAWCTAIIEFVARRIHFDLSHEALKASLVYAFFRIGVSLAISIWVYKLVEVPARTLVKVRLTTWIQNLRNRYLTTRSVPDVS